jgi:hypothetical protein
MQPFFEFFVFWFLFHEFPPHISVLTRGAVRLSRRRHCRTKANLLELRDFVPSEKQVDS